MAEPVTPADDALDTIAKLHARLTLGIPELTRRARISSRRDGYPARASGSQPASLPPYNPDSVRLDIGGITIDYADPTGAAATHGDHRPDPVTRRYRTLERQLDAAARMLLIAVAQLDDPRDTDDNLAWCAVCASVKNDDGRPYLTPPNRTVKGATTVAGRLKEPMILCTWHYDAVRRTGCLPARIDTVGYVTQGRAPRRSA